MNQDTSRIAILVLVIILIASLSGCVLLYYKLNAAEREQKSFEAAAELPALLLQVQGNVTRILQAMDKMTTDASLNLSETGLTGDTANTILARMYTANPYVIDCITVDTEGTILSIEPEEYKGVLGANIGNQTHFIRLSRYRTPMMSGMIKTVEGFPAVDIASPVFSPDGCFIGATTMLIEPLALFADQTSSITDRAGYAFSVMQTDGLIVFDSDPMQVGRMLFDDPLYRPYTELIAFGRQLAASETGNGSYTFLDKDHGRNITKQAYWTTVGMRGTEWRLVITKEVQ